MSPAEFIPMLLIALAVTGIGVSKAGFGGGLSILITPLCVLAFEALGHPPTFTLGVLLPLLCAGDAFSLRHYWKQWKPATVWMLMPGVAVGVLIGVQLIGRASPEQLNRVIGAIAVSFVAFQLFKNHVLKSEKVFTPTWMKAVPFGFGTGITSSFAHGAGPVISMYLVPQKLSKQVHVASRVMIFFIVNWMKVPFFAAKGVIHTDTLMASLMCLPAIPIGVWLGIRLNKKLSEEGFMKVVYALTLLAGLQLLFNFNPLEFLKPS